MTNPTSDLRAPVRHVVHNWQALFGSGASFGTARLAAEPGTFVLYAARDTENAERVRHEIDFYASGTVPARTFPDWETLPYDQFSPHQDIVSERLSTLHELHHVAHGVLVAPVRTLMQRLAPASFVDAHTLTVRTGQRFDIDQERTRLDRAGYQHVRTVSERGEYAVRGALMDVFPMGTGAPLRIDLFDDHVETLRTFDPDTQRTAQRVESVRMLPAREVPMDPEGIARFRDRWHRTFDVDVRRCPVYQDVSRGIPHAGIEYYLPFFFEETATLFDYLPEATVVVLDPEAMAAAARFEDELHARHESLRHDVERPILEPRALYVSRQELRNLLKPYGRVQVDPDATLHRHRVGFRGQPLPDVTASHRGRDEARLLREFIERCEQPVLLTAQTAGRAQHLEEFLARAGLHPPAVATFGDFLDRGIPLGTAVADIERGTWLPNFAVVTESELFGRRNEDAAARATARGIDPDLVIRNLTELSIGAPVVHVDHGIGRYLGLETLEIDGHAQEFLLLEYAEEAKLYVPVTSLQLISRYAGADADHAPLHRLGSDQWEKAKRRAARKAYDVAAELLDIHGRRAARPGTMFTRPDAEYARFCEQFPFETTADQQDAIDAVIEDLCSDKATDRLICGDVGFGKTEVAMRAAFVSVAAGKQVAVLTPTTLLTQQHHETFRDRFADWPVHIEAVSRLRTEGEIGSVAARLAAGKIDIVIGTHRLLGAGIAFDDLGLVVIDEEHRFGVRQKERLRALRAEVDVLALTATPIPRTLNLALGGLRDLSIIATPPAKRLSIKTFVVPKRNQTIREAIARELARGGQVFYVHNEVASIDRAADELRTLVPQARIGVGHGQMHKRALERTMADFYHRRSNLLVCSTIIENGIDIPNANTILINRADKFGLAQLHQLRGRVGRSHHQAYAYLMTPDRRALTSDARKRLDAIEAAGELGIGFTLATHDLEIRGAGELLGEDQSGQIETIGFSLYMEMLERAVDAIRAGRVPNLDEPLPTLRGSPEVNLHVQALIPDDYLPDVHMRLILYKRIANAAALDALDDLKAEAIDRFGPLPEAAQALFRTTEIKLAGQALGIRRIDVGAASGRVDFEPDTPVHPVTVVGLVQAAPDTYRLQDAATLRFSTSLAEPEARFEFVEGLLERLAPRVPAGVAATA